MKVSDYMTADPLTVSQNTRLDHIVATFRRHHIRQVPVVKGEGHLVGIITDRDIRSAVGSDEDALTRLTAEEIMTLGVVSVAPDDDIKVALDILSRRRFGALPVAAGGKVVGIITVQDMLRCLRDQFGMSRLPAFTRQQWTTTDVS